MRHVVLKGAFVSPLAATRPYARQITTTVWVRAAASPAASVNVRRIIVAASGNDNCQSIPNAARELIKSHFRTGTRNRDLRQRALCRTATSRGMALVSWSLTSTKSMEDAARQGGLAEGVIRRSFGNRVADYAALICPMRRP
jgi:hypothetical protein